MNNKFITLKEEYELREDTNFAIIFHKEFENILNFFAKFRYRILPFCNY